MSINSNFINALKHWIQLDDSIKEQNNKIKTLKEQKDTIEKNIIRYIEGNNLTQTNLNLLGNNITYNKSISNAGLSIKLIEEALNNQFNNKAKTEYICNIIRQQRDLNKKETVALKRKKLTQK